MDFVSGLAKGNLTKPTSDEPNNPDQQEKSSNSELFTSAKVVAGAAQGYFGNEPEKYDKAKVAGAGADLLDAATEYGKLDETQGVGKYVNQAEDYLRKYDTSEAPAGAPVDNKKTTPASATVGDSGYEKTTNSTTTTETTEAEKPSDIGGGAGDYIKKAEGFLNKPSDDAEGGGAGDYIKKAEGFLNKPSDDTEGGGAGDYIKKAEGLLNKPSDGAEGDDAGDYIKKAEGFLNKPSGDDDEKSDQPTSQSEGGYGDLLKKAGGFLKK